MSSLTELVALRYRCAHCMKTVRRTSSKAWIRSYCETTGRYVRLMRQA